MAPDENDTRKEAAKSTFDDILKKSHQDHSSASDKAAAKEDNQDNIRGANLAGLLDQNFARLDPNNDGITRDELSCALSSPSGLSQEEFTLVRLLQKYFDTIANMVDEEPGCDSRITVKDKEVLNQFLIYSDLDLHTLRVMASRRQH